MGPRLPIGPGTGKSRGVVFAFSDDGSLFETPKQTPSKNREKDGALALGVHRSRMTYNNQLGVGGRGGRDVEEEVRGG